MKGKPGRPAGIKGRYVGDREVFPATKCTGDWACDGDRHCVCWSDAPADDPTTCCQCSARSEFNLGVKLAAEDPTNQPTNQPRLERTNSP